MLAQQKSKLAELNQVLISGNCNSFQKLCHMLKRLAIWEAT